MTSGYTTPNQFRDFYMKCPNCSSQMFIADETVNSKSHVTFFRCSLCVSEHVSSEPIVESHSQSTSRSTSQSRGTLFAQATTRIQYAVWLRDSRSKVASRTIYCPDLVAWSSGPIWGSDIRRLKMEGRAIKCNSVSTGLALRTGSSICPVPLFWPTVSGWHSPPEIRSGTVIPLQREARVSSVHRMSTSSTWSIPV